MQTDQNGAPYNAQNYVAPPATYIPQMTGGVKVAWFFVGFLGGILGIILAFVCNWDKSQSIKSESIKFAVIGFVVTFVLSILIACLTWGLLAATAGSIYNSFY